MLHIAAFIRHLTSFTKFTVAKVNSSSPFNLIISLIVGVTHWASIQHNSVSYAAFVLQTALNDPTVC